ncbi:MAG: hypothetical protein ACTHKR_12715 [Sphingomonas sp.]
MATKPGNPPEVAMPRAARQPAASAASAHVLRRLTGRRSCAHCNDTGSIWVVCPDAGAVKLPCSCGRSDRSGKIGVIDAGLATALVACCGAAYLLW